MRYSSPAKESTTGCQPSGWRAVIPISSQTHAVVTATRLPAASRYRQAGQGRVWPDAALSGLIQRDRDGHHDHGEQRAHSHIADAGIADRALPGQGRWAGHGEHSQQVTR